jgi:hypothetical protein
MKAAKIRFRFDDGKTADVDLALAYGKAHSQLARYLQLQKQAQIDASKKGGDATQAGAAVTHKDLDDAIRGCLARGEKTKKYVKDWALEYDVDKSTVYRRIKALKLQ